MKRSFLTACGVMLGLALGPACTAGAAPANPFFAMDTLARGGPDVVPALLEDLGYAKVVPEEGGKKIYEITDEGRRYLQENISTVDDIFGRIAEFVEGFTDAPMRDLNQSFQRLARATYKTATGHIRDKEIREKIRDVIKRAADEVEAIATK